MRNPLSIFNFKRRNPVTAVGMAIVLVVIIESVLALLPENALVNEFRACPLPPTPPTWQIMGDSVARGGILATQLNASLPPDQMAYNLALAATGPEFPYFQLKREIAAGRAPQAIIYAPSPHTFSSKRVPLLVGGFCTWPEIVEVVRAGYAPLDVLYGILCKLSYSLRNREQIVGLLKGRDATNANLLAPVRPSPSSGASPQPRWTVANLNATYKRRFSVWSFNDYFFQKFLRLAQTNHIPVYWVTMPVLPAVYECRKQYDFESDYFRFLNNLQQQRLVQPLKPDFLIWNEDSFCDQSHLTPTAAQCFTRLIEEELRKLRTGS
jgi:hypothetical protein